jgi:hypothetical protein
MSRQPRKLLALGASLAASVALLVLPSGGPTPPVPPTPAALAWPHAQRDTIGARLRDGTTFQPGIFLDAHTAVGAAPSLDKRSQRLVLVRADGSVRPLHATPAGERASFGNFAVAGDTLAWAESSSGGQVRLWTVNLRDGRSARPLTADTGRPLFDTSQYDLVIADSRLYWAALSPDQSSTTEIRSIALTGGAVDVRREPGSWKLSRWPWLVPDSGDQTATNVLRNLNTQQTIAAPNVGRSMVSCSPTWCQVTALTAKGYRISVMHPDGSARRQLTNGSAIPAVVDVAALDRFALLVQVGPLSDQTGTRELLAADLAAGRTVEISPDARNIAESNGVLWWATGTIDAPVWHALDLRTV